MSENIFYKSVGPADASSADQAGRLATRGDEVSLERERARNAPVSADGTTVRDVNGTLVTGHATNDGGFLSSDGKLYVSADGNAQYGVTDPVTHAFLPNGAARVIDGATVYGTVLSSGDFLSSDGTILQTANGFVEHGKTQGGSFLASATVDGRQVWGNYGSDGSFLSQDGTMYVPAGGKAEYGITDPVTHQFLPNGVTRVIDGKTVYGTMLDNGGFLSEDGTILQLPNGFVEHGKTQDGSFLASVAVDGKQVWGNYGDDGSFLSQDGTVYIPAGKNPERGITDPVTHAFLPNGATRVIDGKTVYGVVLDNGDFLSEDGTILQTAKGFVEHGKIEGDSFLASATVDGKQVWGSYGDDGSFLSQDGTVYIPAGKNPERGITDPVTHQFLPNGTTRVIDGKTVYGSVLDNGDFLSEDGTILQTPKGFVEHGKIEGNSFVAFMMVDGKQVWGNYGDDGSFLSQDGTTYVPAGGKPQYGVTDPGSKSFLPGGTTYKLSNGTVLYGFQDAGAFWSYDGKTIVLNNGTVVTGTLEKGDGIFTGSDGRYYLIGDNGIVQVAKRPDGSFTAPDGSIIETPDSWKIELSAFQDAQSVVGTCIQNIYDAYQTISGLYQRVEDNWQSPAGTTFAEATTAVDRAMRSLSAVLDSITQALQTSYDNYHAAEQKAIQTFNAAHSTG